MLAKLQSLCEMQLAFQNMVTKQKMLKYKTCNDKAEMLAFHLFAF